MLFSLHCLLKCPCIILPVEKAPSEPAGFCSLLHCRTSCRNPYPLPLHPQHSLLSALQSGFPEPCSVVVCSGLQLLNDFFFFHFAFLSPSLPLQHSYHGAASPMVFPPLTMLSSVVTQRSHITVI